MNENRAASAGTNFAVSFASAGGIVVFVLLTVLLTQGAPASANAFGYVVGRLVTIAVLAALATGVLARMSPWRWRWWVFPAVVFIVGVLISALLSPTIAGS